MSRLKIFVDLPEVKDSLICDRSGTLLEHSNMEDAESISAVMGYLVSMMEQAGESLGLSDVSKISLSGPNVSCFIFAESNILRTVYLEPTSSRQEFEKKVDAMKRAASANKPGRIT